jgi:arabinan endo-1,5-alpha-L-arabinosidase
MTQRAGGAGSAATRTRTFTNPVITDDQGTDHGDPFVLRYLGGYFLYHTTDDGDAGISLYRSDDLVHWQYTGSVLEPVAGDHWAQTDLWAPEVMYWAGTFYMYVSATRMGPDGQGVEGLRRQGLARAHRPEGPFRFDDEPLVRDAWTIDGHPFQDEDGTQWLFYNTRTEETKLGGRPGSGTVVDRLVRPDRLEGLPRPVAFPTERWEGSSGDDAYWNEASWVLKRRGRYHHLYSGGFYRDATYGIGVTVSELPRGPWRKNPDNPIFRSGERITGPGHHSIILAPDGVTSYAVYHGYDGTAGGRKVHLDPVHWAGDRPRIGTNPLAGRPTEGEQDLPPLPAFDPAVPFWHADLWACGERIHVGPHVVALGAADDPSPWRVRVNQSRTGLRVWVDGCLTFQDHGVHAPDIRAGSGGEILHQTVTSHLTDEAVRWLASGERHRWAWGGTTPLEVRLAIRGDCRLEAGGVAQEVRSPLDRFAIMRLDVPNGAEAVYATGLGRGARVTDLFVAAR